MFAGPLIFPSLKKRQGTMKEPSRSRVQHYAIATWFQILSGTWLTDPYKSSKPRHSPWLDGKETLLRPVTTLLARQHLSHLESLDVSQSTGARVKSLAVSYWTA